MSEPFPRRRAAPDRSPAPGGALARGGEPDPRRPASHAGPHAHAAALGHAHAPFPPEPAAPVPAGEIVAIADLLVRFRQAFDVTSCELPDVGQALSPHQIRAAMQLAHRDGQTVGELAESLGISFGWASRVVDELGGRGFVVRQRDPDDRRVVRVRLTPEARRIVESVYRERACALADALADLTPEQRVGVRHFLTRLNTELERLAAAEPPAGGSSARAPAAALG